MVASIIMGIVGMVGQIGGGIIQGVAARKQAETQAMIMRHNARVQKEQAALVTKAGKQTALRSRNQTRRLQSAARVGFAKSGASVNTGSPLLVALDNEEQGVMEALTIEENAALASAHLTSRSELTEFAAEETRKSGKTALFGSILGGSSSAAGQGFNMFQGLKSR